MPTGFPSRRQLAALPYDCGRNGYTGRYRPHGRKSRGCQQCWLVRAAWLRGRVAGGGFLGHLANAAVFMQRRAVAPTGKPSMKDRLLSFAKGLFTGRRQGRA